MSVTPLYRCMCGTLRNNMYTTDICHRCGDGLLAVHLGSAVSAQPSLAAQTLATKLAANPTLASPSAPVGVPGNPKKTVTVASNGKTSVMVVDLITGFPLNDTRQG
jgi:hypothetical protein